MKKILAVAAALVCLALAAVPALAVDVVQPTGYYASDYAGVLSAEAKNHIECQRQGAGQGHRRADRVCDGGHHVAQYDL